MGGVFINYRDVDGHDFGALLYEDLTRRFGADRVFMDVESIQAGQDYVQEILTQVRSAAVALVVIGPGWLTGAGGVAGRRAIDDPADWVRRELAEAFASGVPVVPVLTGGAELPAAAELPADIAALSRCQARRLRRHAPTTEMTRIAADLVAMAPELAATQVAGSYIITERRRTLTEREQTTLARLRAESNLAGVAAALAELGDYEQAVVAYDEHVAHLVETLGEDHPETLAQSVSMLTALHDNGDHRRALELAQDTYALADRRLGGEHPTTLASMLVLASSLRENGQFQRAKSVDQELLDRCERLLGTYHPRTLQAATALACDHASCGDPERARDLNERTLDRCRRVLGEDHPDTLACAMDLAADYAALGQSHRAADLHADTLRRYRRTLGDDHPDTVLCAATAPPAELASPVPNEHRWWMPDEASPDGALLEGDDVRERRS